jgi:hypothetical protein
MKGEKPIYRPQRFAVFGFQAIPCQIRDGNHQKVVLFAKADQVRHTRHGAVLVDDLADDASRIEAREPGKIDRSLGLAAALENAAGAGAKGKNMYRSRKVFRVTVCVNSGPDRLRPIVSRNARGYAVSPRID